MGESVTVSPDKTVLASIRHRLGSLPPGDRRVAEVILEVPHEVIHMTVSELAARAGSAESTTVRCCRKLGYGGYQDLKIRLARELATQQPQIQAAIDQDTAPYEILRTVLAFDAELLKDITSGIGEGEFEDASRAIARARRVILVGFGSSYFVCLEAHERLSSAGLDAVAPESPNMKLLLCSRTTSEDVVVCVSHTGATKELIRYAEVAKANEATVIAVTSYANTRLARTADIALVAGGRDLDFRFDALSGRLAHLAVLDALYMSMPNQLGERATASLATFHDEESAWRL